MTFPFRQIGRPRFTGPLPEAADVVVIGGGIAGVMTAWYLHRAGQRVVLCEKGRIAAEQSGRNWGWVRQQGRDPAELPLMIEALSIWKGLGAEVAADLGFRQEGILYLANGPADMAQYEAWLVHARAHGLDSRLLSRAEVDARLPNAAGWVGGLLTPSDGRAEPFVAVPAIAAELAAKGATVREACAVRTLDLEGGRVRGVVTEAGRIRADRVVVAGGSWSGLFLGAHGAPLPQLAVRNTVAMTAPMDLPYEGAAADNDFAIRKRLDGGLTLTPGGLFNFAPGPMTFRYLMKFLPVLRRDRRAARIHPLNPRGYPDAWTTPHRWTGADETPFERMRILDPPPDLGQIERARAQFAAAFPSIGKPLIVDAWAGMIDTMPDVVPVIDHVAALPGLTVATGLSGHGFGIGPAIGRVTADLVMGRDPGHDLGRFRFARFSDGSPIEIGPTL